MKSVSKSKSGKKKVADDSWISWKVGFKAGTSEKNMNKIKTLIDKYITDYIHKIDSSHQEILVVDTSYKFNFSDLKKGAELNVKVDASTQPMLAVRVPHPPPPPPSLPGNFAFFG